jgi:hypothetical protein
MAEDRPAVVGVQYTWARDVGVFRDEWDHHPESLGHFVSKLPSVNIDHSVETVKVVNGGVT